MRSFCLSLILIASHSHLVELQAGYSYSFDVTDSWCVSAARGAYRNYPFGKWCVRGFVDRGVSFDPGWVQIVGSKAALAKIDELKSLLDNPKTLEAIDNCYDGPDHSVKSLESAIAVAYLNYFLASNSSWTSQHQRSIASAKAVLTHICSAARGEKYGIKSGIAGLALARMTLDTAERRRRFERVAAEADNEALFLGLAATMELCRDYSHQRNFDKLHRIAEVGVTKYQSLSEWSNYSLLKSIKTNPTMDIDGFGWLDIPG